MFCGFASLRPGNRALFQPHLHVFHPATHCVFIIVENDTTDRSSVPSSPIPFEREKTRIAAKIAGSELNPFQCVSEPARRDGDPSTSRPPLSLQSDMNEQTISENVWKAANRERSAEIHHSLSLWNNPLRTNSERRPC